LWTGEPDTEARKATMAKQITIRGIKLTTAAAENLWEVYGHVAGANVTADAVQNDRDALLDGELSAASMLDGYLSGSDEAHDQGWRDYVSALVAEVERLRASDANAADPRMESDHP
jgi:hypothetical protein